MKAKLFRVGYLVAQSGQVRH